VEGFPGHLCGIVGRDELPSTCANLVVGGAHTLL